MIIFTALLLVTSPFLLLASTNPLDRLTALKFTDNIVSYITFSPKGDLAALKSQLTVCSWLRHLGRASYPVAFALGDDFGNVRFQSNGEYNNVAGSDYFHYTELEEEAYRTWYHACLTWQGHDVRYYINGTLRMEAYTLGAGIKTTNPRPNVTLGNYAPEQYRHQFGGEMLNLNLYSRRLSEQEINGIYQEGMCSVKRDSYDSVRFLKWEEMLREPRTGGVKQFHPSQCLPVQYTELLNTERKLEEVEGELTVLTLQNEETEKELQKVETKIADLENKLSSSRTRIQRQQVKISLLEKVVEQRNRVLASKDSYIRRLRQNLKSSQSSLSRTSSLLKQKDNELEEVSAELERTRSDLHVAMTMLNRCTEDESSSIRISAGHPWWEWDLLVEYLNKTLTREMVDSMSSVWNNVTDDLLGSTVTNSSIVSWQALHPDQPWQILNSERYLNKEVDKEILDNLVSMWDNISDKLPGIRVTLELIDLLKRIQDVYHYSSGE